MKKIFGGINISWKILITISFLIGISVGVLNRIPILNNTSFQDIAVYYDMWIILAIFIIVNCKSLKEAVSKCFIFFLISQPIIYLTEIIIEMIFYSANFNDTFILYFKNYYIGAGWFKWTILTIPGSAVAYQIKKDNILSAFVLSVATAFLAYRGTSNLMDIVVNKSVYHLLNAVICLVMAFALVFIILKKKTPRIISTIITCIGIIVGCASFIISNDSPIFANYMISLENNAKIIEAKVIDENIATVTIDDDNESVTVYSSKEIGTTQMILKDENQNEYTYLIESSSRNFNVEILMEENKNFSQ